MIGRAFILLGLFAAGLGQRITQLDNPQFQEIFPNDNNVDQWPTPRSDAVGVYQRSANKFWVWGGKYFYNITNNPSGPFQGGEIIGTVDVVDQLADLNVLDITLTDDDQLLTADWNSNITQNNAPTPRHFSSSILYNDGAQEYMYVIGGTAPSSQPLVVSSFDMNIVPVWRLRLDEGNATWEELNTTALSGAPTPRYGASVVIRGNDLILFGGYSEFLPPLYVGTYYNDTYSLNLDTNEWSVITPSNGSIPARAFHTSTLYDNLLWVFAGEYAFPTPSFEGQVLSVPLYNDVWTFNFSSLEWQEVVPESAVRPNPRINGAAVQYRDVFIIYGGFDKNIEVNNMFIWDFGNRTWTEVPSGYPSTFPRRGFVSDVVDFGPFGKLLIAAGRRFPQVDLNGVGLVSIDPLEAALADCVPSSSSAPCQFYLDWDGSSDVCCIESEVETTLLNFNPVFPTYTITETGDCDTQTSVTFVFNRVVETDSFNSSIQSVNMNLNEWNFAEQESDVADVNQFNLVNDVGLEIGFSFTLQKQRQNIQFGSETFDLDKQDNKWSFSASNWEFLDEENLLALEVQFSSADPFKGLGDSNFGLVPTIPTVQLSNRQTKYFIDTDIAQITFVLANFALYQNLSDGTTTERNVTHRVDFTSDTTGVVRIFFPSIPEGFKLDYDPDFAILLSSEETSKCKEDDLTDLAFLSLTSVLFVLCVICCCCCILCCIPLLCLPSVILGHPRIRKLFGLDRSIAAMQLVNYKPDSTELDTSNKDSSSSNYSTAKITAHGKTGSSGPYVSTSTPISATTSGSSPESSSGPKPDNEMDEALKHV